MDVGTVTPPELQLYHQLYGLVDETEKILSNSKENDANGIPLPTPPPGAPNQDKMGCPDHLPDGSWNTYNGQAINFRQNERGLRVLPGGQGGARFIPPDEYKEFLQLGHGGIFDLNLDNIDLWPWRERGCDLQAYFNYDFNEKTWRKYIMEIRKARLDMHLKNQIETTTELTLDSDLPAEVRRVLGNREKTNIQPGLKYLGQKLIVQDSFFERGIFSKNANSLLDPQNVESLNLPIASLKSQHILEEDRTRPILVKDSFSKSINTTILDSLNTFQNEINLLQIKFKSLQKQDMKELTPEIYKSFKVRMLEIKIQIVRMQQEIYN